MPRRSKAFFTAAKTRWRPRRPPAGPTIEWDKSHQDFFADIATGRKTPAEAAKDFDAHLDEALNAHP